KLRVATDPTYPPMGFRQADQLKGFDIDLAHALAKRLGVQVEFVPVNWIWKDLASRLKAREFDVLISSVTVTEERLRDVDFVEYLRLQQVFVVRKGISVRREKDLESKIVAVQADTAAQKYMTEFKQKGVAIRELKVYATTHEPFDALRRGDADITLA